MQNIFRFLLATTLLGLASCGNNSTSPDERTGTITGKILVQGPDGEFAAVSGAKATLIGRGFSSQTNDTGSWTITNVPAGIYRLLYEYPDHYSLTTDPFQFVGRDTLVYKIWSNTLYFDPSAEIAVTALEAHPDTNGWYRVTGD